MTESIEEATIVEHQGEHMEVTSDDALLSLKNQIAEKYVDHLKTQKEGWLSDIVIGEGNVLKDYLVSEGIGDRISDAIKGELFGKIFDAVDSKSFTIGGIEYKTIFDYLKAMKERLDAAKTDVELNVLLTEVNTLDQPQDPSADHTVAMAEGAALGSSVEIFGDRRKSVLKNIDAILQQDERDPIHYAWGGKTSIDKGLDCSGFVTYAVNHAGLSLEGWNSRSMFKQFSSKKLDVDDGGAIVTDVSDIKEGDMMFLDSLDPRYEFKVGPVPSLKKDGQKYRIHHVAFVKSIDRKNGVVHVVESTGSKGITENKYNVADRLTKKGKVNSALYVAHIDYDSIKKMDQKAIASLEPLPGISLAA